MEGPNVINVYSNDGGYLVVLKKEHIVITIDDCVVHCDLITECIYAS